ncbi:MAG: hypothetical protein AB1798_12290 [Spirochaetota bacterium]
MPLIFADLPKSGVKMDIFIIVVVIPIIIFLIYDHLRFKEIRRLSKQEKLFEKAVIIGYWKSEDSPFWPDPAWFVDSNWDYKERSQVCDYLTSFEPFACYAGLSWCRFRCKAKCVGCAEYTDGIWRWPEGLVHYVKEHDVRLPDEFVKYAIKRIKPKNVDSEWWRNQRGWNIGSSSFLTPGFYGRLELVQWTGKPQKKAILFIRELLKCGPSIPRDILKKIRSGQQVCLSNNIDYCDAKEVMSEGQQYGLTIRFCEQMRYFWVTAEKTLISELNEGRIPEIFLKEFQSPKKALLKEFQLPKISLHPNSFVETLKPDKEWIVDLGTENIEKIVIKEENKILDIQYFSASV